MSTPKLHEESRLPLGPVQPPPKYKELGDALLAKFGDDKSLSWLASQAKVTRTAVHLWLTGKCRPRRHKLGTIAAILELHPDELAHLAEYESEDDLAVIRSGYESWYVWKERDHNLVPLERRFVEAVKRRTMYDMETRLLLSNLFPEYRELMENEAA